MLVSSNLRNALILISWFSKQDQEDPYFFSLILELFNLLNLIFDVYAYSGAIVLLLIKMVHFHIQIRPCKILFRFINYLIRALNQVKVSREIESEVSKI